MDISPNDVRLRIPELRRKMNALLTFGDKLAQNLQVAGQAFNNANFLRARAYIMKSLQELSSASNQLAGAENYVNELTKLCEEYLKLGFDKTGRF